MYCFADLCPNQAVVAARADNCWFVLCGEHAAALPAEVVHERKSLPAVLVKEDASV